MPLDGQRSWSYANEESINSEDTGTSSSWNTDVVKISEERVDNMDLATLEYQEDSGSGEEGTPLFRVTWSSDSMNGIIIHGYEIIGEEPVVLDPHVQITTAQSFTESTIETSTNVGDFTATFEGIEVCPNRWVSENDEPWECAHLNIQGPDSAPFIGDWWTANTWGTSIFNLSSGPLSSNQSWVLTNTDWEPN